MKTKVQRMHLISGIVSRYNDIENADDLRREKITLAEYHAIPTTAAPLTGCKADAIAKTPLAGVAAYFKRYGFTVTQTEHGFYAITF